MEGETENAPPVDSALRHPRDPAVPRGAVRAYIDACRRGDYSAASGLLDLSAIPDAEQTALGPQLARKLKFVLDRKLWIHYEKLSARPEGQLDDGLPPALERVGTIEEQPEAEILLERIAGEGGQPVWRFSSGTVARIPDLYEAFGYGAIGERLPPVLFETSFLEIRLIQWVGLLLLVVLAYLLSWVALRSLYTVLQPIVARSRTELDDVLLGMVATPIRFLFALAIFVGGSLTLLLAEPVMRFLGNLEKGLALVGLTWIALRLVDVASELASENLDRAGRVTAKAVIPLGRRTVKVFLFALAFVALLQNLGFNVTGLIAGLGVGGLAVALAAQKSVENLFGGVTLVTDQPVRVGDFCRFADGKLGTVEEIGLRSTRVRTLDRTVVSVPNSQFSEFQLENFAKRDRIRLYAMLGLRYETAPDQLRHVLTELRKLLIAHPRVADRPRRVRFSGFGAFSLDVEVYAMIETTDYDEFCAIREDIFLRMIDIVNGSGTGFAFPSQTLYLGRDGGLDAELTRVAGETVRRWRENGRLPFPDFPAETEAEIEGTLAYPPEGSATRASSRG